MSGRFAGRSVLVTGASSGIGRACALAFGREGAAVVAAGRRRERLDEVVKSIEASGGRAVAATGDVRDAATADALVKVALDAHGKLDGLVHGAGVLGNGSVIDGSIEEWDRVMDSNVRSIVLLTRAAAQALIATRGSIASISSGLPTRPSGCVAFERSRNPG